MNGSVGVVKFSGRLNNHNCQRAFVTSPADRSLSGQSDVVVPFVVCFHFLHGSVCTYTEE